MHIVVINRGQQEYVKPMQEALAPHDPLFVFDRCSPVEGCCHIVNSEGEGFLAGKMRDLGAAGVDDDILFLDGDKIPDGDIVADIGCLSEIYGCICYGIRGDLENSEYRGFMREDQQHGQMPWQASGFPFASGCYSCGMWICRDGIRRLRELNGSRIFHPAFDGTWGDEDNFVADELHYSGFKIGYSTHVRLSGEFSDCRPKMDGYVRNFIQRIHLRKQMFNAEA